VCRVQGFDNRTRQPSPVSHALVTVAVPVNFDDTQLSRMVIGATIRNTTQSPPARGMR
jgi:hypothetical protein